MPAISTLFPTHLNLENQEDWKIYLETNYGNEIRERRDFHGKISVVPDSYFLDKVANAPFTRFHSREEIMKRRNGPMLCVELTVAWVMLNSLSDNLLSIVSYGVATLILVAILYFISGAANTAAQKENIPEDKLIRSFVFGNISNFRRSMAGEVLIAQITMGCTGPVLSFEESLYPPMFEGDIVVIEIAENPFRDAYSVVGIMRTFHFKTRLT